MLILGINASHADASAALLCDGELVAAVEEERFKRVKHYFGFPEESINWCLRSVRARPKDIDGVAISRNPRANLLHKARFIFRERPSWKLIQRQWGNRGRVSNIPAQLRDQLGLSARDLSKKLHWVEHHPAHLASAFWSSPYERAAVSAIDGFGDSVSTSGALGEGSSLKVLNRVLFPHSLGQLYLAITQFLGFPNYGDEYKVMGLASFATPDFARQMRRMVRLQSKGSFQLDLSYFNFARKGVDLKANADGRVKLDSIFSPKLEELLGPRRLPQEGILPRHEAIAASLQLVFEECLFHSLRALQRQTGQANLCLAGGCALNSVANGKITRETPFARVFIQPAAADNGTALGAALYIWNRVLNKPRQFVMEHAYWGPSFAKAAFQEVLLKYRLDKRGCQVNELEEKSLCQQTAKRIALGQVIGWFQGRSEWGPRALGNRSILADPRRCRMPDLINSKVKYREDFRPFAASILEGALPHYFTTASPDPFMLRVHPVNPDKLGTIPAVTHVDGTARVQTVDRGINPLFYRLIQSFQQRTGIPLLLNTSFNASEPMVLNPAEAIDCFLRTDLDVLVLGPYLIEKTHQTKRPETTLGWSQDLSFPGQPVTALPSE